ncbi:hypothetical protein GCM10027059_42800 [Myceligenerans halotolerans]
MGSPVDVGAEARTGSPVGVPEAAGGLAAAAVPRVSAPERTETIVSGVGVPSRCSRMRRSAARNNGIQTSSTAVTISVVIGWSVRGGTLPAHQNRSGSRAQVTGSISTAHTGRSVRFWFSSAQSKWEPWMLPVSATFRA